MSKIKNYSSILEPVTGKVGPVIFYFWKGIYCVRTRPQNYRDANSVPQQRNRQRFNLMVQTLKELLPVIQVGFSNEAHHMSPYNKAFSENFHRALLWNPSLGEYQLHPERLLLSKGLVPEVCGPCCVKQGNKLHIQWVDNSALTRASEDDRLIIFLYNQTLGESCILTPQSTRKEQSALITLPNHWGTDKVHLYLSFGRIDNENMEHYSNSLYVTTLNQEDSIPIFAVGKQQDAIHINSALHEAPMDQSASKHQAPPDGRCPLSSAGSAGCDRNSGGVP